ncbi:MAG: glycoside hydrolase family 25 protein [Atopobiaceae bacterium]|nr:glycoside hydrolase family 25 protein [Atopobiaceae bacterium]
MTKKTRRLLCCVLAFATALLLVPRVAMGDEGYYYDDTTYYDDSYYDETYYDDSSYSYDETYSDASYEDYGYTYEEDYSSDESYGEYSDASVGVTTSDTWDFVHSEGFSLEGGTRLFGIDVSEWNAQIDWERVQADGVEFAILKCGGSDWIGGGCYADSEFVRNAKECERRGIPYGVYFFSTADNAFEAAIEAKFVSTMLVGLNPSLPIFLDLELEELSDPECAGLLTEVSQTFCGIMEAAGWHPGIYASYSWWEYLLVDPCFDNWAKWIAAYDGTFDHEGAQCWQFSHSGWIDGIDWPVDLNYWFL